MKEYNRLKYFIFFLLFFYLTAGLSTEFFVKGREKVFPPFFSWFLFIWVPNENSQTQYTVRITEANGKKLDPPLFFNQAYGIVDDPRSQKAMELIRRWGMSFSWDQENDRQRFRRIFEQVYLPPQIRYELVIVKYKPLDRFKYEKYDNIIKLAEFTKE